MPLVKILGDIASVAVPVSLATLLGRLISSANMVLIPRVLMRAGAGYEAAMEGVWRPLGHDHARC